MTRISVILLLLILNLTAWSQSEADSLKSGINTFELIGMWKNMAFTLERYHPKSNNSSIGAFTEQRISIPVNNESKNQTIIIEANGTLRWEKHLNAKWNLDGKYLFVTTEFGNKYKGFITKDILANTYLLTLDGETYKK